MNEFLKNVNSKYDLPSKIEMVSQICTDSSDEWDFCRRFVYSGLFDQSIIGCAVAYINNLGEIEYGAKFGRIDFSFLGSSIWGDGLASKSVRVNSPQFASHQNSDGLSEHLLALPIHFSNTPLGLLLVASDGELSKTPNEVLSILSSLLGFVLKKGFGPGIHLNPGIKIIDSPEPLSSRQLRILELMANQQINAEIARELMMSESTIRQESVKIYRALGVSDRSSAVKRALEFGLLKNPETVSK